MRFLFSHSSALEREKKGGGRRRPMEQERKQEERNGRNGEKRKKKKTKRERKRETFFFGGGGERFLVWDLGSKQSYISSCFNCQGIAPFKWCPFFVKKYFLFSRTLPEKRRGWWYLFPLPVSVSFAKIDPSPRQSTKKHLGQEDGIHFIDLT